MSWVQQRKAAKQQSEAAAASLARCLILWCLLPLNSIICHSDCRSCCHSVVFVAMCCCPSVSFDITMARSVETALNCGYSRPLQELSPFSAQQATLATEEGMQMSNCCRAALLHITHTHKVPLDSTLGQQQI